MRQLLSHLRHVSRREDGFTMIAAIMILFVSSLLVTVTLVSAGGDIALTHNSVLEKKAYYAAMAGLSAYKYNLTTSSGETYWTKCPSIAEKTVAGTTDEHYSVITMHSEGHTQAECEAGKQAAIIETSGSADGTFRIESTGTAGTGSEKATRKLVATFSHPGFLNYVYLTNYEVLDPAAQNPEPTHCEHYYKERAANGWTKECGTIVFASEDKINGPMHTNDAAALCAENGKKPTFGRKGHHDKIEMNGGHYAGGGSCKNELEMYGEYTEKGPTLTPPETDTELLETADYKWKGRTEVELKATDPNTLQRTVKGVTLPVEDFPANGVIYDENEGSCSVKYSPYDTDTDYETDEKCGNVYIHGEYTEALTIAAQNDIVINGNLKTKTEGTEGKPVGEGRLGLIATNFVRIYHPVKKNYVGSLSNASFSASTKASSENTNTLRIGAELKTTTRTEPTFETTTTKSSGGCYPSSEWESYNGKCYSKKCSGSGYAYIGEGKCEKCSSGYEYIGSEKKCASTSCSSGYSYAGEGTCYKCSSGYEYIGSEKKCASTSCATGESYLTGEGLCAKCPTGDLYVASEKKCATTSCSNGYTYAGNWECAKCSYGSATFEPKRKECVSCESGDTYLKETTCEYENSSSGCDAENEAGSLENPVIDAAILSTAHSFIVDNFMCGKHLGELTIWGAIAQFWRGTVGEGEHGYVKNYNYDERLEYLQPPDFLSPTSSQLKLDRVTAASS